MSRYSNMHIGRQYSPRLSVKQVIQRNNGQKYEKFFRHNIFKLKNEILNFMDQRNRCYYLKNKGMRLDSFYITCNIIIYNINYNNIIKLLNRIYFYTFYTIFLYFTELYVPTIIIVENSR